MGVSSRIGKVERFNQRFPNGLAEWQSVVLFLVPFFQIFLPNYGLLQAYTPAPETWPEIGVTYAGPTLTLAANTRSLYGLAYSSVILAYSGTNASDVLTPGNSITAHDGWLYPETEDPVLQHQGYYFANPNLASLPGQATFSPSNPVPILVTGVADNQFAAAGYAQLELTRFDGHLGGGALNRKRT